MNVLLAILCFLLINITSRFLANGTRLDDWKASNKMLEPIHKKSVSSWINGDIPYYLDTKSYDHLIAMRIRNTMNSLEGISCIRFKPIIGKPITNMTWLHITNPSLERECVHEPIYGKTGEMTLVFGLECLSEQQVLHTLMHGIGFHDEVTHPERDRYIRVLWENIQPAYQSLYRIRNDGGRPTKSAEYDPMSVMQFHDRAFSVNGHATIAPLIPGLNVNPSEGLSQLDTMKLRLKFGHECKKRNADDLLEMCKAVLYHENKQNEPPNPSIISNQETNSKQKSLVDNESKIETSEKENASSENASISKEGDDELKDEKD